MDLAARASRIARIAARFSGSANCPGVYAGTATDGTNSASVSTRSGSVSGSVHRGWINLKAALSSNEPHAVLAECERGEDSAVAAYKEALDNQDLDLPTRELLNRQYHEVKGAHDKVKQLRDGVTYRKAS